MNKVTFFLILLTTSDIIIIYVKKIILIIFVVQIKRPMDNIVSAVLLENLLNSSVNTKKHTTQTDARYQTMKPRAYLCLNEGQYDPWWSKNEFHWNRCKEILLTFS